MTEARHLYAIALDDHTMSDEDFRRYLVFIDSNKLFFDWHCPFRGFVIVVSSMDIVDINENLMSYFDNRVKFALMSLPAGGSRASFAEQTWDWLDAYRRISREKAG